MVVVLANGGVVQVATWEQHARAILEGWLNGQAGGGAIADLLFGRANPCGRLAETIPLRLQDTPAYLNFPGDGAVVSYGERLYVGYRYYDAKDMSVSYPFGHGLSYTAFAYSGLHATVDGEGEEAVVRLELTVTNTGPLAGKEVVQVYVGDVASSVDRPIRELKAFTKVEHRARAVRPPQLRAARQGPVVLQPRPRPLGPGGRRVRAQRRRLIARPAAHRHRHGSSAPPLATPLTLASTIGEWLAHPAAGPVLLQAIGAMPGSALASDPTVLRMVESLPLGHLILMTGGRLDIAGIGQFLDQANAETR